MNSERELFEEWYCRNHTGLKQSDLAKFRTLSGYSFSDSLKINISWEAWQASASRQGYKLVPVEPTQEMLDAQDYIRDESAIEIYKAMIGAVDE